MALTDAQWTTVKTNVKKIQDLYIAVNELNQLGGVILNYGDPAEPFNANQTLAGLVSLYTTRYNALKASVQALSAGLF